MHPSDELVQRCCQLEEAITVAIKRENELRSNWPDTALETLGHHYGQRTVFVEMLGLMRTDGLRMALQYGDEGADGTVYECLRYLTETINDLNELIAIGEHYINWAGLQNERPTSWDAHSIEFFEPTGRSAMAN